MRFQQFCEAHSEKVDRIGRFVRVMEARSFAAARQRGSMIELVSRVGKLREPRIWFYYPVEPRPQENPGKEFTLCAPRNTPDSVRITDETAVPKFYCRIDVRIGGALWETILSLLPDALATSLEASVQGIRRDADAIKSAVVQSEVVSGAEVRRGSHLKCALKEAWELVASEFPDQ